MCFFLFLFLLVFQKSLLSAGRMRFLKIKSKKTKKVDQFLTYKKGNLGPVFNFTAYIYVYIYVCAYGCLIEHPFLAVQGRKIEPPFLAPSGNTTKIGVSRPRLSIKKPDIFENETSQVFWFSINGGFRCGPLESTRKHYFSCGLVATNRKTVIHLKMQEPHVCHFWRFSACTRSTVSSLFLDFGWFSWFFIFLFF